METVEVQLFAALTDYFDRKVSLEITEGSTVTMLIEALEEENPEAKGLLKDCRFAVDEQFVDLNYALSHGEKIFILPPSSGG